jgi:diguanylate cyclase (GGDEF)-like protein
VELAIKSVAESLTGHLAFDELASTILDQYMSHAGANTGAVAVERDGELSIAVQHNFLGDAFGDRRTLQHALRSRSITSVRIPEDLAVDGVVVSFRPREVLVVPTWFGGQPLGGVVLAFSEDIHPNTSRLLEAFQASTSVALNNALTHERFQRLATLDPLTEAYNRRFGLNRLNEEFSRTTRTGVPLGIISLDLDHFKQINDTYGHLAGDRVLRSVARNMFASMRAGDILMRTGGEEFVLLLPGAGHNDVGILGERIRRTVELNRIDIGVAEINVTISLGGLAYYGTDAQDPEDLLSKADQSMYLSKESGRNRLTMARLQTPVQS